MIERFGGVAQLGERTVRIRKVKGSNPSVSTTSEQALYRLLRLFLQKSERAHAAAPPFQTEPAALGFDLVLGAALKVAESILLRCYTSEQALYRLLRLFCKSQSALMPLLLLSKPNRCAGLQFGFGC